MTLAKEWKEGCLTNIMRGMSSNTAPSYGKHQTSKWVVLDGDVDAVWVESLNTVMDDNKVCVYVIVHDDGQDYCCICYYYCLIVCCLLFMFFFFFQSWVCLHNK
jgi:hypothetical protein